MTTDLIEQITAMPVNTFYPEGARENNQAYIERHHVAMGGEMYTVWAGFLPHAVNLTEPAEVADAYAEATKLVN